MDDITTGEGLGILRDPDVKVLRRGTEMVVMTPEIREFMREPTLLIVIKANVSSRVHRRVPDGLCRHQALLRPTAGWRANCVSSVCSPRAPIPARSGKSPMSATRWRKCSSAPVSTRTAIRARHSLHILEDYPRDEIVQVDVETLYNFVMEVLILNERPRLRALARADKFDRFVSILVFIPREKYDTDMRTRVAAFLAQIYKGTLAASYVSFPEGALARVHYIIGRYEGKTPVVERATLEAGISAIAATWGDKLKAALPASTDGMRARMLANRYAQAFTGGYTEAFDP